MEVCLLLFVLVAGSIEGVQLNPEPPLHVHCMSVEQETFTSPALPKQSWTSALYRCQTDVMRVLSSRDWPLPPKLH